MKEEPTDISEGISIIEDDGETVIIEVSEENYQRDLALDWTKMRFLSPVATSSDGVAFSLVIQS